MGNPIRCTNCNFTRDVRFHSKGLVYTLSENVFVDTKEGSYKGWCEVCQDICDVERPFDLKGVPARIVELKQRIRADRWRPRRMLGRFFGRVSTDESELRDQESLLLLARSRKSTPRCLDCGSEGAIELVFHPNNGQSSFRHSCGGHLQRLEAPKTNLRMNYRFESYRLDSEGRRL